MQEKAAEQRLDARETERQLAGAAAEATALSTEQAALEAAQVTADRDIKVRAGLTCCQNR